MSRPEIFSKNQFVIKSGISPLAMGPGAKIFIRKIWSGGGTFGHRLQALCEGTLAYSLICPTSWLIGPQDDPQPFDHHLLFRRLGASFCIVGGIENPGVPFRELAAFHRGINHNEFGDNPRVPGWINKLLSDEYQNNII
jgi:hypothetical protein